MRYLYTLFAVVGWGWLVVVGGYLVVRLRGARGVARERIGTAKPQAREDAGRVDVVVSRQEMKVEHEEQC